MRRSTLRTWSNNPKITLLMTAALGYICLFAGCGPTNTAPSVGNQNNGNTNVPIRNPPVVDSHPAPTASEESRYLPDSQMTPGDVIEDITKDDVCTPGYSKKVRNVPQDLKKQAYQEYGITSHKPGEYEVDHLISLELGGSNSLKNLWPESYLSSPWNAHVKDRLENKLHEMICSGEIDMKTAQHEIATDWIAAYKKYVGPVPSGASGRSPRQASAPPPETERAAQAAEASANSDDKVWVNTRSGVYWKEGTEYYGKTKEGKYMTERDAVQQGYHLPRK